VNELAKVIAQLEEDEVTYTAYLIGPGIPQIRRIITKVLRKQFNVRYLEYNRRGEFGNQDPMLRFDAPAEDYDKIKDAIDAGLAEEGREWGYDLYHGGN
jgi:hypothetical protein